MAGTNLFSDKNGTVDVALTDAADNGILISCTVANMPSSVAGYAVSCVAHATDTGALYLNTGTTASSTFTLMDTSATSLQLPEASTDATTTTGVSLDLTQNLVTTGVGLKQTMNALTTGFGHSIVHTTAVIADGGSLQNLSSTSIDTSVTTGVLQNLSSTASVVGTQTLHTYTAVTTGIGDSLVMEALTTGTGNKVVATAATLTTGRYYSADDGTLEVFGIGANGHIHTLQTTAQALTTNSTGISAVVIVAGSSDVAGSFTTTGTPESGTILTLTFHKTYTAAPKAVMISPANAAGGGVNTEPIITTTATTIVFTWPGSGVYAATPSISYMVIA